MSSATTKKATTSRDQTASDPVETKTEKVIKLLRRKNGATIANIQKATGWQPHSVRGFLSGTLKTRMGLVIKGETDAKGVRHYRIARPSK